MSKNYLEMSDEEVLAELATMGHSAPSEAEAVETPAPVSEEAQQPVEVETPVVEPVVETEMGAAAEVEQEAEVPTEAEEPTKVDGVGGEAQPTTDNPDNKQGNPSAAEAEAPAPIDFEAAYKQLIGPIKANGKTIEIKSVEEAQRLMQMGAGFGRKMNELQPHLKTLRTLENNGIAASDLNYLIDLHQRKPDAIRKLVQDSGLDPLEMDMEKPVNYQPTDRSVSDNEIRFQSELDTLKLSDSGQETINVVNRDWDAASVQALYETPGAIQRIDEQRNSGVYAQIVAEMDRQYALGKIPAGTPFMHVYTSVGNWMGENGLFAPAKTPEPTPVVTTPPQVQPLARRAVAPAPVPVNPRVAAAAPTKVTQVKKPTSMLTDIAQLSDEEFTKRFGNKY